MLPSVLLDKVHLGVYGLHSLLLFFFQLSFSSAKDNLTGESVAVKKITNCFTNLTDTKRIIREVKLLRHLRGHENVKGLFLPEVVTLFQIISLKNIFPDPAKTATSYEEM